MSELIARAGATQRGFTFLLLAISIIAAPTAYGAPRVVLGEEFSATW